MAASIKCQPEVIAYLVERHQASPNVVNQVWLVLSQSVYAVAGMMRLFWLSCQEGWTPLMLAADKGKSACVQVLIDAGADINKQNKVRLHEISYCTH